MCSRVQLDRQEHGCSSRSRRKLWMIYEVKFTETFQGEFNLKRWICFKFHCINKLPIWISRPEAVKDALRILYHSEFSIIPHCKNYASTTIIFCAKYSWLLWATKAIAIHSYVCFDIYGSPAHGQRMLSSSTRLFSSKFSLAQLQVLTHLWLTNSRTADAFHRNSFAQLQVQVYNIGSVLSCELFYDSIIGITATTWR